MERTLEAEDKKKIVQCLQESRIQLVRFHNPYKEVEYRRVVVSLNDKNVGGGYFIEKFTDKQVFHEIIREEELSALLIRYICDFFQQMDLFTDKFETRFKITKKGKLLMNRSSIQAEKGLEYCSHMNRKKHYIIEEGVPIEPLVDMGIFTKEGKVVQAKYDKFRQINRFLEMVDDSIKQSNKRSFHIIDFGCGKSYLTFILYYYFVYIKQYDVTMVGLDLKADVIKRCNETAAKYGYNNLEFKLGDINGYKAKEKVDMVVTLHACDIATDYALYNAIKWNTDMIFSVPCCQHELNNQIATEKYAIITRYGIVKERMAALMTDSIRANLLETCGYKTQIMEFVDFENTPKNLLIRARKKAGAESKRKKMLAECENLMQEFSLKPKLYCLLKDDGLI